MCAHVNTVCTNVRKNAHTVGPVCERSSLGCLLGPRCLVSAEWCCVVLVQKTGARRRHKRWWRGLKAETHSAYCSWQKPHWGCEYGRICWEHHKTLFWPLRPASGAWKPSSGGGQRSRPDVRGNCGSTMTVGVHKRSVVMWIWERLWRRLCGERGTWVWLKITRKFKMCQTICAVKIVINEQMNTTFRIFFNRKRNL